MIGGERAQALIEAVVAMPVCIACAVTIVDGGMLVRDRIATAQAATRAAEAQLRGDDPAAAARGALPTSIARTAKVRIDGDRIQVLATSDVAFTRLSGRRFTHRSDVELAGAEVSR